MKVLVCKKQHAIGCDYTIGCGMRYDVVEAESLQQAGELAVFPDGPNEGSALEGDNALCQLLVVPWVDVFEVDMETVNKMAEDLAIEEEKDRAELARLLAKYGDTP